MSENNGKNTGRIEEITGVVVDVVFPDQLPEIFSAIVIEVDKTEDRDEVRLVCEVQQHLGDDRVRTVAMDATDGLQRGDRVVDTGGPITVPVGDVTLGRIFNLLGEPIDGGDELPPGRIELPVADTGATTGPQQRGVRRGLGGGHRPILATPERCVHCGP